MALVRHREYFLATVMLGVAEFVKLELLTARDDTCYLSNTARHLVDGVFGRFVQRRSVSIIQCAVGCINGSKQHDETHLIYLPSRSSR